MCASVLEGGPSQKVSSASNLASSFLLLSIWGVGWYMDGEFLQHILENGIWATLEKKSSGDFSKKTMWHILDGDLHGGFSQTC